MLLDKNDIEEFLNRFTSIKSRAYDSRGNSEAVEMLENYLLKLGAKPKRSSFSYEGNSFDNLYLELNGTFNKTLLFCAHIDSASDSCLSPGADDNGSGVAVLLWLISKLWSRDLRYNLIFLFSNLEEVGGVGSLAFSSNLREREVELIGVINIDTIGKIAFPITEDNPLGFHTHDDDQTFLNYFKDKFSLPIKEVKEDWEDDHYSFYINGYSALELTEFECNPDIHSKDDSVEKIDFHSLEQVVDELSRICVEDRRN